QDVVVVVEQLLPLADRLDRVDEDAAILDNRLAVRVAGVVDVLHAAAADARVDHRLVVDLEQERVMTLLRLVVVAAIRFLPRNALTAILADALAGPDVAGRECAPALHR